MKLRDWVSTLLVTFIILTTVMQDVGAAEEKILVGFDGNAWKRVIVDVDSSRARLHKFLLLRGVLEGLVFGASPLMTDKTRPDSIYIKTTYNHLIDALDQFYSDYRNEEIFIVWALQIISMELKGVPKEKIESTLTDFRRQISTFKQFGLDANQTFQTDR